MYGGVVCHCVCVCVRVFVFVGSVQISSDNCVHVCVREHVSRERAPRRLGTLITNAIDETSNLINEHNAQSYVAKFRCRRQHHAHLQKFLHLIADMQ